MPANKMFVKEGFKLGAFSSNCSSGMTVSSIPERWVNSWDNNLKLAQMLDEAGMDFILPVARWIGCGGDINFQGNVLETMTWAAALLAKTKDISVFSTTHAAFNHPVVAAKQIATMDQIGNGRAGLNIVAGWNKPEFKALGLDLPDDHETRYGYAQEWFDIVSKIWADEGPFDYKGKYFNLEGIQGQPAPVNGVVPVLNAAGSGVGRDFATRNANYLFTPAIDLSRSATEIQDLIGQAAGLGRDVGVLTFSHVTCRPTEKEAKEYRQHVIDHADWKGVETLMDMLFANAQSFPHDLLKQMKNSMALGHGAFELTGTPRQVADRIIELQKAGFAGTTLSFVDYVEEFPYFRDEVLPLLTEAGIR